jgi:hypothetical protein
MRYLRQHGWVDRASIFGNLPLWHLSIDNVMYAVGLKEALFFQRAIDISSELEN